VRGGACTDCGAPLASDQAACPICASPAEPAGPGPVILKTGAGLPIPPQTATLVAIAALGFGGVIGSTLSGGLGGLFAAAADPPSSTELADEPTATGPTGGGGSGGGGRSTPGGPSAPAPAPSTPPAYLPPAAEPPLDPPLDPTDPPKEGPEVVRGTVVHVNEPAESYSVASGGALVSVHARPRKLPEAGIEVRVPVAALFNTTSKEAGSRKELGESDEATFSGTVTYVDEKAHRYVLSSAGASVVVAVPDEQASDPLPAPASSITVDVAVEPTSDDADRSGKRSRQAKAPGAAGEEGRAAAEASPTGGGCEADATYPEEAADPGAKLVQKAYTVDFDTLSYASLEGVVQAVCGDEVVVSADDLRLLGADLELIAPKKVDLSAFEPGTSITAAIDPTPTEDGTYDLRGIAGDDGATGADDEDLGQGDLAR